MIESVAAKWQGEKHGGENDLRWVSGTSLTHGGGAELEEKMDSKEEEEEDVVKGMGAGAAAASPQRVLPS